MPPWLDGVVYAKQRGAGGDPITIDSGSVADNGRICHEVD